jgi:hypothetical protein
LKTPSLPLVLSLNSVYSSFSHAVMADKVG